MASPLVKAQQQLNGMELMRSLLAHLPATYIYSSRSSVWVEAMHWLRHQYGEDYPSLLADLTFRERVGYQIHSAQVSAFLTWLHGTYLIWIRPSNRHMQIDEARQAHEHQKAIEQYGVKVCARIQYLADELLANQRAILVIEEDE